MIWQDNVITSGAFAANASGQVYRIDFEASPAVYAAENPQQAAQASDELLIEVLRGDEILMIIRRRRLVVNAEKIDAHPVLGLERRHDAEEIRQELGVWNAQTRGDPADAEMLSA